MKENAEVKASLETLRQWIKPGATVYTKLGKVARSGISRQLQVIVLENNEPRYLTYHVANVLNLRMDKHNDFLKISGCGMDMGFHVVYHLGRKLFPHFTCTGLNCGSSDHSNGDRNYKRHQHSDAGYALRQRWL